MPEIAAWFSGGGFSNYVSCSRVYVWFTLKDSRPLQWARPSYQDTAVTKYLSELAPGTYAGLYNA